MNLFLSLTTSMVIVLMVWALAFFQPHTAMANHLDMPIENEVKTEIVAKSKSPVTVSVDEITITGLSQTIPLTQLPLLWQTFNETEKYH